MLCGTAVESFWHSVTAGSLITLKSVTAAEDGNAKQPIGASLRVCFFSRFRWVKEAGGYCLKRDRLSIDFTPVFIQPFDSVDAHSVLLLKVYCMQLLTLRGCKPSDSFQLN